MIIIFPLNDGCAMGFFIRRIALLDIKSTFCFIFKITPLFQFEIAFSNIWIFLIPRGGGGGGLGYI